MQRQNSLPSAEPFRYLADMADQVQRACRASNVWVKLKHGGGN